MNSNNYITKSIKSKERQEINEELVNGNDDEKKIQNSVKKSFKETPLIMSKKKTQLNLNSDKDETFSNIINFVNQDLRRGSNNQTIPLNNFVYKINSGNTYSSIHKSNISYNSSKNVNENKNANKRNSFSNKKMILSASIFKYLKKNFF